MLVRVLLKHKLLIILIKMVNYDKILAEAIEMNDLVTNFKIVSHTEEETEAFNKKMETDYVNIKENFGTIFKIVNSGNMDIDKLTYMIEMVKKIENNKISEYNASVEVGKVLVKDFITDKK
jgi:hypothetical protein